MAELYYITGPNASFPYALVLLLSFPYLVTPPANTPPRTLSQILTNVWTLLPFSRGRVEIVVSPFIFYLGLN
jgi:hypothetical protein